MGQTKEGRTEGEGRCGRRWSERDGRIVINLVTPHSLVLGARERSLHPCWLLTAPATQLPLPFTYRAHPDTGGWGGESKTFD